jgi:hypothetical protein
MDINKNKKTKKIVKSIIGELTNGKSINKTRMFKLLVTISSRLENEENNESIVGVRVFSRILNDLFSDEMLHLVYDSVASE